MSEPYPPTKDLPAVVVRVWGCGDECCCWQVRSCVIKAMDGRPRTDSRELWTGEWINDPWEDKKLERQLVDEAVKCGNMFGIDINPESEYHEINKYRTIDEAELDRLWNVH